MVDGGGWWRWVCCWAVVGGVGWCGLLGEWGRQGPLEVLVCQELWWSVAE